MPQGRAVMSHAFKCDRCKVYNEGGCRFELRTEGRKLPNSDATTIELCASCEQDWERWLTLEPTQLSLMKAELAIAAREQQLPNYREARVKPGWCARCGGIGGSHTEMCPSLTGEKA